MRGNDRSGTVDNNLNLFKAVELALTGGYDLLPFTDPMTGKTEKPSRSGAGYRRPAHSLPPGSSSGRPMPPRPRYIIQKCVEIYEQSEAIRARFYPTPYLSCLVQGLRGKGAGRHPGRRGDQLHHPRGGHLRHHGGFAAGDQVPGLRQKGLHHGGTDPGPEGQLGGA